MKKTFSGAMSLRALFFNAVGRLESKNHHKWETVLNKTYKFCHGNKPVYAVFGVFFCKDVDVKT